MKFDFRRNISCLLIAIFFAATTPFLLPLLGSLHGNHEFSVNYEGTSLEVVLDHSKGHSHDENNRHSHETHDDENHHVFKTQFSVSKVSTEISYVAPILVVASIINNWADYNLIQNLKSDASKNIPLSIKPHSLIQLSTIVLNI